MWNIQFRVFFYGNRLSMQYNLWDMALVLKTYGQVRFKWSGIKRRLGSGPNWRLLKLVDIMV